MITLKYVKQHCNSYVNTNFIVSYRPSDSVAKGVVGSVPVTRDTIRCHRKRNKMKNIGCYQLEDDGYVIVSIAIGIFVEMTRYMHVYMYIYC